MLPFRFTGFGKYMPPLVVLSADIERRNGFPEGSIERQLGVVSRHIAIEESNTFMAARALEEALGQAGVPFSSLDLLIHASVSQTYILPNTATMIQKELGMEKSGVPCLDVNQSCLSFLSALEMAAALLQTGSYRRIGIVSSEKPSVILDGNNPETSGLFGDGAAAVILERDSAYDGGLIFSRFETWSDGWDLSIIPGGGLANPGRDRSLPEDLFTFQMQHRRILLYTIKVFKTFLAGFEKDSGFHLPDITRIISHQASRAALQYFNDFHGLRPGQLPSNLATHGNCVAASIPILLYDEVKKGGVQTGDPLLLIGTAAGISVGACMIKL